ncbi:Uncharacterised protein [Rodentibacter pneumotropicus]|uniref:Uncharacterized protein n=2 Tax=Rodentibacter pneumotropicus TaxID=758 RepID=A0A3S4UPB5_9PAST|nr:Uncharacterised protein [Rodentibacter pneumotropicus]
MLFMNTTNQIYAIDVFITTTELNNEKSILLVYATNPELAQNKIRIYQQIHQMQNLQLLRSLFINTLNSLVKCRRNNRYH